MSLVPYDHPTDVDQLDDADVIDADAEEVDDDRRMAVVLAVIELLAGVVLVALAVVAGALVVNLLPVEAVFIAVGLLAGAGVRLLTERARIVRGLRMVHDVALALLEGLPVDFLGDHRMYQGRDGRQMVKADDDHARDEPYDWRSLRHQRARVAQWRWNRKYT